MVQTDSLLEPALDIGAVGAGKTHFLDGLVDGLFFFLAAEVEAHEVLRVASCCGLRKVDHIDGRLAFVHQLLYFG